MTINLQLCLDDMEVDCHPQLYMQRLGINWKVSVPVSFYSCWFFFDCSAVPDPLPSPLYLTHKTEEEGRAMGPAFTRSPGAHIKDDS